MHDAGLDLTVRINRTNGFSRLGPARPSTSARDDVCDGDRALRSATPIASFDRFGGRHRGDGRGQSPLPKIVFLCAFASLREFFFFPLLLCVSFWRFELTRPS